MKFKFFMISHTLNVLFKIHFTNSQSYNVPCFAYSLNYNQSLETVDNDKWLDII